jgi:2-C-methyl-D-erythritol 4-phosphate cytidylyltransferase
MRYFLVMPAAGSGRRFSASTPKQYAALGAATVIEHSLSLFEADPDCAGIVVVTAGDDATWPAIAARRTRLVDSAVGGAERVHSVRAGLLALASRVRDDDWIMVHDAARPCLAAEDLARLKQELAAQAVGGLLAIPLADTLKRAAQTGAGQTSGDAPEVDATVERQGLWRAATPQVFRFGALLRALDAALTAQRLPTDEAQALEWAGQRPRLVAGRADNIKVTTADDLELAAAILRTRESASQRGS